MKSDIEIAREVALRPIAEVAADAGLSADEIHLFGPFKAKVDPAALGRFADRPRGKLVLVSGITPTPSPPSRVSSIGNLRPFTSASSMPRPPAART